MIKDYTEEEFRTAVAASTSISQVRFKLDPTGRFRYHHFYYYSHKYKVDTSHFTGQGWNKNQTYIIRPMEDYFSNECPINAYALKNKMLKLNLIERICSCCNLTVWQDKLIPLELDHIDGNKFNNAFENLRLLCPNCHAQTPNYRGKNKTRYTYNYKPAEPSTARIFKTTERKPLPLKHPEFSIFAPDRHCPICDSVIPKRKGNKYCSAKCVIVGTNQVDWAEVNLQSLFEQYKTVKLVAEHLHCNEPTLRKQIRKQRINIHEFK